MSVEVIFLTALLAAGGGACLGLALYVRSRPPYRRLDYRAGWDVVGGGVLRGLLIWAVLGFLVEVLPALVEFGLHRVGLF
jgi:hypothetical protein